MTEHSQPGRLVGGRYRLVDRLGAGGMGRVWRAHDQTLGIDVAIKEVSLPATLSDKQLAERLRRAEREARNTARLRDQPGIVTVHDVVIDDDAPWIVMQLVAGRSLDEHLRDHGPLSVENTAKVADTMLRALAAAHAAGIVHRDVKPANVLLADDGRVLLTDFGIAQHESDSSLTMTGAVIGSAEYLAPERARADDAGPASDLFSLGVTLYQAVEGISPFRRDSPTATMTAVLFEQPAPPKHAGRLSGLLAALLAKDPRQRPSVPAALAMLGEGGSGGPGSGSAGSRGAAAAAPLAWQAQHAQQHGSPTPHTPLNPHVPPTHDLANRGPNHAPAPYLAAQTLTPAPPRQGGGSGTGLKVGVAVAVVAAVAALATLGVVLSSHHGTPTAGPGTSSSATKPTTPTGTPTTSQATSATTPDTTDSQDTSTTDTAKAGCTDANDDLNAFNRSNPAGTDNKTLEIQADHDLASKLAADAAEATDPTVQAAIQAEADSWNAFANDYTNGDTTAMSQQIPQTTKDIAAVNAACNS